MPKGKTEQTAAAQSDLSLDICAYCKIPFHARLIIAWFIAHPFNPIALRKAKILYSFGLSECNRVNKR